MGGAAQTTHQKSNQSQDDGQWFQRTLDVHFELDDHDGVLGVAKELVLEMIGAKASDLGSGCWFLTSNLVDSSETV